MRILHVTDTFLPRLGGIELHVADLAARQRDSGHDVMILTGQKDADSATEPGLDGIRVERMGTGFFGVGIGRRLAGVLAGFEPDIVHAHLTVGSPFTWGVLRNTGSIPIVISLHSLLPQLPRLIGAGIKVLRLPTSQMIHTAVSDVAADRLRAILGPAHQVHVLHNGVDAADWVVKHVPTEDFNILCVGRLAARKRPLVLVDALAELADRAPELAWSATFVGDGAQRAKVAAAVRAHGLEDRIALPGRLERGEIRSLLGSADVLVAPATLESFGIAALEARCAGVPIIGMASSGVSEFITDGVDGLLARDDSDIASCLHRLAADEDLARDIRRHNTTVAVDMEWSTVTAQHELMYDLALERAGTRASSRVPRRASSSLAR
ncbi:MAG: glycosyl transferase [Marmoricola sp.]|nr:glycosyl transferase [Marmoricola sp.]